MVPVPAITLIFAVSRSVVSLVETKLKTCVPTVSLQRGSTKVGLTGLLIVIGEEKLVKTAPTKLPVWMPLMLALVIVITSLAVVRFELDAVYEPVNPVLPVMGSA